MQILILGMHRSGTSVVARLLNMMGAYFAPEGISTGSNEENPKGFWERQDVRSLNDALLHSADADWHRLSNFSIEQIPEAAVAEFKEGARKIILSMDAHRPWFLKEPRFCLLAPLWLELLELPLCLIVYRSPLEVARSLETRNHFSIPFGLALWERYNTALLEATRDRRRIQINHADLMATPVNAVRKLEENLRAYDVQGLRLPSNEEILAFIDPALYRAKETEIAAPQKLSAAQRALNNAFRAGKALLGNKLPQFSESSQTVLVWEDTLASYRKENTKLKDRDIVLTTRVSKLEAENRDGSRAALESKVESNKKLAEVSKKLAEVLDKLRVLTASRDEARQNALTADEVRTALQHEMKLVREAARADATNAALRAQHAEVARLNHETQRLKSLMAATIKRLESALAEKRALVDELAARNKILNKGLSKIESTFERLQRSRSFHFMVYTARRLGLVSRTPRRCVEEIKNRLVEIRSDLNPKKKIKAEQVILPELPRPGSEQKSAPLPVLREFDTQSIERITNKLAAPVSIVVPIYNSPEELRRCIESVLLHTRTPFELVLVDDCSPDPAIASLLEIYETRDAVRVIRSAVNQGFVRSANVGFQASQFDVVLLNSDTEVTPRWLQKLKVAAYSDAKIATVTPFSNAAGAFSVPEIGVNAPIPFPFTALKMALLIERVSRRAYPDVPTGNGFCMYIKRETLEAVGGLDEENFGRGYGEENDFCMRASQAGWRHIIDDSLFVYHRGNSSFGEEKQALLKENRQILDRLHPTYTGLVKEFTNSPDVNAIRARIGERMKDPGDLNLERRRILYILQEGGGGVPMTNADLVSQISATHECYLLTSTGSQMILRVWANGRLVDKKQWKLPGPWSAKKYSNPAAQRIYFEVLTGLGIDLVHIRHLFKHSLDAPFLCKQLGIPVVLSFHDYYFVCPSVHLLDQDAKFCGGECTPGLQQCTIPSPMLQDLPMLKEYLPEWRRKIAEVLDCCDAFITTAESVREVHQRAYPQLALKPFRVIEHGRNLARTESVATAPQRDEPVRILVAGNIDLHKGSILIRQLHDLDQEKLLEFHFVGQPNETIRDIGVHHGPYQRDDFPKLAREIAPSFAAVVSIWAETYSHTLTEAWSVGLPVLGSNLGAVGERIAKHGGGWIVDATDAAAVMEQIKQIIADRAGYQEKAEAASRVPMQTIGDMADGYRALYERLLAGPALEHLLRVGRIEPRGDRGSTFVRLRLPFAHEEMQRDVWATRLPRVFSANEMGEWIRELELDVIVVQREALTEEALGELVASCRSIGIRLVLEIDDNLLEVDESHTEYAHYGAKIESVKYLAGEADDVVVSTSNLAASFVRLNKRTRVIPNALDEWLWFRPMPGPARWHREKTIVAGYMGTRTHTLDLDLIREPFFRARERLNQDHGVELLLQIVGGTFDDRSPSWFERIEIPRDCTRYPEFVRWLRRTLSWDFGLAPLVDNPFNQSKSALKFLEYAALGVPAVFSNVGEYAALVKHRENGLLVSSDRPEEWEESLVELATSESLRASLGANARSETERNHLLRHTVPVWKDLLNLRDEMTAGDSASRNGPHPVEESASADSGASGALRDGDAHDPAQCLADIRIISKPAEYSAKKTRVLACLPRSIAQMVANRCKIYKRIFEPAEMISSQARRAERTVSAV